MNEEQKIIQKYFLPIADNPESLQLSNDAAFINKQTKYGYIFRHDD